MPPPYYIAPASSAAIGHLQCASNLVSGAPVTAGLFLGEMFFPWRSGSIVGMAFGARGTGARPPEATEPVYTVLDVMVNGVSLWGEGGTPGRPMLSVEETGTFSMLPPNRSRALKYGDYITVQVASTSILTGHTLVTGAVAFHSS